MVMSIYALILHPSISGSILCLKILHLFKIVFCAYIFLKITRLPQALVIFFRINLWMDILIPWWKQSKSSNLLHPSSTSYNIILQYSIQVLSISPTIRVKKIIMNRKIYIYSILEIKDEIQIK